MDWVNDLVAKTGRSKVTIYKAAKELGRIPTAEEILNRRKAGRPSLYMIRKIK